MSDTKRQDPPADAAEATAATSPRVTVRIDAPAELANGIYANVLQVRQTDWDFVLDFGHALPPQSAEEADKAVTAGLVTFPSRARIILPVALVPSVIEALRNSLEQFAEAKGIKISEWKGAGR